MHRHGWLLVLVFVASLEARAQFQMEDSHTTADLRGIDNVGAGVAWASGTNGTVLRTEDGGYLWQACSIPPGAEHLDFRGIQAFDANTAIVMSSGKGDLSRLYKTTDGCQSWKLLFSNPDKDGFWDALSRTQDGPSPLLLLSDPVDGRFLVRIVYPDHNPLVTYTEKPKAHKGEAAFAASNSSLFAFSGGAFLLGTGGTSGTRIIGPSAHGITDETGWVTFPGTEVPLGSATESSGIFSISFQARSGAGARIGVAVGGDYKLPDNSQRTAAFTSDGGKTWTATTTPPHGYRSAVAYDTPTKTWITVGPNGTDVSTDDGRNWRAVHPDPALHEAPDADRNWNALSLPFVVGPHGRIGKLDPRDLANPNSGK